MSVPPLLPASFASALQQHQQRALRHRSDEMKVRICAQLRVELSCFLRAKYTSAHTYACATPENESSFRFSECQRMREDSQAGSGQGQINGKPRGAPFPPKQR